MHIVTLKVLLTLTGIVFISGCAGVNPPAQLEPVPEIYPGILQGYIPTEKLPNSLSLLPPAPAKGSAAD